MNIIIFMTIRNISNKEALFKKVYEAASKISKEFYIVNHGSNDNTIEILKKLSDEYMTNNIINNEEFIGTMDDMKAKHYKILKKDYQGNYIFALDWDEVLSDELIIEINNLDFKNDIYLIKRDTYFLNKVISKNELLPLFFEINSVEINTFNAVHNLYKLHSNDKMILNGVLNHFSFENIDDIIKKTLLYSKIEGDDLYKKDPNISSLKIFFIILLEGIYISSRQLFLQGNIKNIEGILYSLWIFPRLIIRYMYYLENKLKEKYDKL